MSEKKMAVRQTSTTVTANSGTSPSVEPQAWETEQRDERFARDLFDVLATGNKLRIVPRNAVAASLLSSFLACEIQMLAEYRANYPGPFMQYGAGMVAGEFTFTSRPLLSTGGDPHFTGLVLSAEEISVARAAVDAHRAAKSGKPRNRVAQKKRR